MMSALALFVWTIGDAIGGAFVAFLLCCFAVLALADWLNRNRKGGP